MSAKKQEIQSETKTVIKSENSSKSKMRDSDVERNFRIVGKGAIKRVDPWTTIVPFIAIAVLCIFFFTEPDGSTEVIGNIRSFLGDSFGSYYLIIGLGVLLVSL